LSGSGPTDSTACCSSGSLQCSQFIQLRRSHSCSRLITSSSSPVRSSAIDCSCTVLPAG